MKWWRLFGKLTCGNSKDVLSIEPELSVNGNIEMVVYNGELFGILLLVVNWRSIAKL